MARAWTFAMIVLALLMLAGALGPRGSAAAAIDATSSAPPPIPTLPTGPRSSCTMRGPAWVLYGVHAPNGRPRRGSTYLVNAWGISCRKAKELLRAFFPKIPAHPMGRLKGGPKGYTCKGRDDPGTVTKSRGHDGSCIRLKPAAMFDWGPTGGKVT